MNLTQKIFAGVGVAALATAAVFPYAKSYVDNLPKQLNKEQAAERYLDLVCPLNKIKDYQVSLEQQLKTEYGTYYSDPNALANANNRVGSLQTRLTIATDSLMKKREKNAKDLLNPKYIWPTNVQTDIKLMAEQDFKDVGFYNVLKNQNRNMTKSEETQDQKDSLAYMQAASRIRQNLDLPPIGKGCEKK